MRKIIAISLITFYLIPCVISYNYTRIAHSKGGIYEKVNPGAPDLFFTFAPFFNLAPAISWISKSPLKRDNAGGRFNSFFNVKK